MARQCTICTHPERAAIEAAIVAASESYRDISIRFEMISRQAISRHKQNCMRSALASVQRKQAEQMTRVVEEAAEKQEHFVWDVLTQMGWLNTEAWAIYRETRAEKDHRFSLQALGLLQQQTKLFSELLAGQEPGQAEKLEAEWLLVREAIFTALEPYPDALLAVMRALLALKDNHDYQSGRQLLPAGFAEQPDSTS